jgi:hypothetical protein
VRSFGFLLGSLFSGRFTTGCAGMWLWPQ